ncbi:hypothetical protein CH302_00955 [Rhodococcus sp. 15-2388-1-1a]|nr:hypothetical protein CH302_00955 [Rhodococcus sp. 15-2388-1-1a]
MIESARYRLSGLSAQSFDDPAGVGETRTFTITATCTSRKEEELKSEGKRWVHTMRLDSIVSGVQQPSSASEPSLFDGNEGDEIADEPTDSDEDPDDVPEPTTSDVSTKFENPSFSSQD